MTDTGGNPIADGSEVSFRLVDPVAGALISSPGRTNLQPDCDIDAYTAQTGHPVVPREGTAFTCLRYVDNLQTMNVTVVAEVASDSAVGSAQLSVRLPFPPTPTATSAPTGTPTRTPSMLSDMLCGDGTLMSPEECDDGNNLGGDGCARNCTTEVARTGTLDPARSGVTLQTEALPIPLVLTGSQIFRTGKPVEARRLADGTVFAGGEVPVTMRADEFRIPPVKITGLVCACLRGVPSLPLGPGNFASGSIACGEVGGFDRDYRLIQDHNTSPGSSGNRSAGTPDDPECDDVSAPLGVASSSACTEGSGENCSNAENQHLGVCNGPRSFTRFGGNAGRGSALVEGHVSVSLLRDSGTCSMAGKPAGRPCPYTQYGADCLPCTDDDMVIAPAERLWLTTGTADAAVYDANNNGSTPSGAVIISGDRECFGPPCLTSVEGTAFDCAALAASPIGGLSGGSMAFAYPAIDAATIGDAVVAGMFFNQ